MKKSKHKEFIEQLKAFQPYCSDSLEERILRDDSPEVPFSLRRKNRFEDRTRDFPEKRRSAWVGILCGIGLGFLLGVFVSTLWNPFSKSGADIVKTVYVEVPQQSVRESEIPERGESKKPKTGEEPPRFPQQIALENGVFERFLESGEFDSVLRKEEKRFQRFRNLAVDSGFSRKPILVPKNFPPIDYGAF